MGSGAREPRFLLEPGLSHVIAQARSQLAPLHCWLTDRINIPTAINRASRVPTASERARFRRSSGFDPAPFCAAPMPSQKSRLPIDRYLATRKVAWALSAVQTSAEACPGQQSLQPPAARTEELASPELSPEGVRHSKSIQFVCATAIWKILQSILIPSAVTTGVQSATSAARDCRNFSGVESRTGSKPVSISICW